MKDIETIYETTESVMQGRYKLFFYVRWYWKNQWISNQFMIRNRYNGFVLSCKEYRDIKTAQQKFENKVRATLPKEKAQAIINAVKRIMLRYDDADCKQKIINISGV